MPEQAERLPMPEHHHPIDGYPTLSAVTMHGTTQVWTREQAKVRPECDPFNTNWNERELRTTHNPELTSVVWGDGYEQIDHIRKREFSPETIYDAARYMINRIAERAGLDVAITKKEATNE